MNNNSNNKRKVFAIISDYDGTLCPTSNIRAEGRNRIPKELEGQLMQISRRIPVCILSSKDYQFLHDKVPFANVISCILGIETVVVDRDETSRITNIRACHLLLDDSKLLESNDHSLNHLAEDVASRFPEIEIERKFTLDGFLAGITLDWRNQKDWMKYSTSLPAYIKDVLLYEPHCFSPTLHLQTYKSHPFVDVYTVECNKGFGFDCIIEELKYHRGMGDILYLGDSENDNTAFRKAGFSVGIVSDPRLNSDLECEFVIDYNQLANFLGLLMDNDFVVSEKVLVLMRNMSSDKPKNEVAGEE
jgi:HAD superfamily hydrolase (TIGR01484 family)